jgi:hypothetical protein
LVLVIVLWCRLPLKAFMKNALFSRLVALFMGWLGLAGVTSLAIWFLGDAGRLHQFSAHSLINSARACFFRNPRA